MSDKVVPEKVSSKRLWASLLAPIPFLLILLVAAALRLANLDNRPMHCDEAVHAVKFGQLLQQGRYVYDPAEYHGPSLNFLTLPVARAASAQKLTEITPRDLRLVPAAFGILLVGLIWWLREELGYVETLWAALLTAVSGAMVFYSRYYIQEMLLVWFTFAAMVALWRCARADKRGRRIAWAVLLGSCVGMMHASKETCVIPVFAMVVAGVLTCGLHLIPLPARNHTNPKRKRGWQVLSSLALRVSVRCAKVGRERDKSGCRKTGATLLFIALLAALGVSALFFSSFLDNPRGVLDSYATYLQYLGRAAGEGNAAEHVHPWYYYFQILFWCGRDGGPVWTEAFIGLLALVGLGAGAVGRGVKPGSLPVVRFLGIYTVLVIVVYSLLPYKTPWCALGFLQGMILLAGVGATVLVRVVPARAGKALVMVLLLAATGHLAWQAYRASFVAYEDPRNPYVYAHTSSDLLGLVDRARRLAEVHPDGLSMHVQVICTEDDYWPLPWYMRDFDRVGWTDRMPDGVPAPLIITQPELEPELLEYLYVKQPPGERPLYAPVPREEEEEEVGRWQLRPHVPLAMYVRLDLWETYQAARDHQK